MIANFSPVKPLVAVLALVLLAVMAQPADAQSRKLERRLVRISEVMGALHYLRGACYRPERTQWRSQFDLLLKQYRPQIALRNQMTDAFHGSYVYHQRNFNGCNGNTAAEASILAEEGERLSRKLANMFDDRNW